MKKIVRLSENDFFRLTKKIIKECNPKNIHEEKSGKSYNIYLAGPNVFKKDAIEDLNQMKTISKKYNQIGNAPIDNEVDFAKIDAATRIFHGNVDMMDKCDVIIANLEPFRGPNVDDGTAFELGYGYSKGKIMYGYMTHANKELKDITSDLYGNDEKFPHVENFKYPRNLMIVDSIRSSGGDIFKTFEECVKHLVENH
jgi:nucleoside 2-deoxyribosyltransferase